MPDTSLPRDDLRATLEARRDLGPEYEDALVDSFLEKLDSEITARVRAEVAVHQSKAGVKPPKPDNSHIPVALGSLGIAIPLTAIAAGNAGTPGLFLAWGGIVLINLAYALGRRRN
ncbi:hypothetical protein Aple_089550 [Acrocarpospora pleiomorpha]|uniref:Integral membrane protein n=1 Tax=Acrocarpospora pleiomorpha TaxID=90975 RepID=A0A5M3XYP6_9ACTN|nr:hypothetical protein [Acrocarpospora pleiomorpha]GES26056.1 hypothetical protein Aple_089550 [Acrocarpospora pleiomorpha]